MTVAENGPILVKVLGILDYAISIKTLNDYFSLLGRPPVEAGFG